MTREETINFAKWFFEEITTDVLSPEDAESYADDYLSQDLKKGRAFIIKGDGNLKIGEIEPGDTLRVPEQGKEISAYEWIESAEGYEMFSPMLYSGRLNPKLNHKTWKYFAAKILQAYAQHKTAEYVKKIGDQARELAEYQVSLGRAHLKIKALQKQVDELMETLILINEDIKDYSYVPLDYKKEKIQQLLNQ